MMKVRIPYELKLKFLNMEGLISEIQTIEFKMMNGIIRTIPTTMDHIIILDLSDYPECFKACCEWNRIIESYFKTSYTAYKLNIGPYEGVWPYEISEDGIVKFRLDEVYPDKKNWKDWFIKEDFEYAPKINS